MSAVTLFVRRRVASWKTVSLAALCCLAVTDRTAWAGEKNASPNNDPPVERASQEARRLYDDALAHFKTGELDKAVEELKAAYAIDAAPELLYNLGQAYRLKGDCARALDSYRHFLATNPTGIAHDRAEAKASDMEKCAASEAQNSSGAAPHAEAVAAPAPPTTGTPAEERPPAAVSDRRASVAPAAVPKPTAQAPWVVFQPHSAEPRKPSKGWRHNGSAWALTIAAAVLMSASGYFAWRAHAASDRTSEAFERGGTWTSADADNERTGVQCERLAIGTGVLGLAAGGIATWLFLRE